jgi:hypothetical protein
MRFLSKEELAIESRRLEAGRTYVSPPGFWAQFFRQLEPMEPGTGVLMEPGELTSQQARDLVKSARTTYHKDRTYRTYRHVDGYLIVRTK